MSLKHVASVKRRFRPWKYQWDKEELYRLRHVERFSFPDMARTYGCDHKTVMWAFRRLEIPSEIKWPTESGVRKSPLLSLLTEVTNAG